MKTAEKQKAYDEFSSILLFIFAVRCRYALTLEDLGLEVGESLLQRLITQGHTSGPLQDVDEKTKENVGAWIKALFVSEHISEEALPCGPQEFYSMISIVTSQSMAACERNRLAFETLKAGFDSEYQFQFAMSFSDMSLTGANLHRFTRALSDALVAVRIEMARRPCSKLPGRFDPISQNP